MLPPLERDAWSMVKRLTQATQEYAPPAAPRPRVVALSSQGLAVADRTIFTRNDGRRWLSLPPPAYCSRRICVLSYFICLLLLYFGEFCSFTCSFFVSRRCFSCSVNHCRFGALFSFFFLWNVFVFVFTNSFPFLWLDGDFWVHSAFTLLLV